MSNAGESGENNAVKKALASWIGTAFTIALTLILSSGTYFVLQYRVSELEKKVEQLMTIGSPAVLSKIQRVESEQSTKVQQVESDIKNRMVRHELKTEATDALLREMREDIKEIRRKLEEKRP